MIAGLLERLSEGQRKAFFAVVALVVVGLGGWAMSGGGSTASSPAKPGGAAMPASAQRSAAPTLGTGSDASRRVDAVDSPVNEAGLRAATKAAATFVKAYKDYNYAQDDIAVFNRAQSLLATQNEVDLVRLTRSVNVKSSSVDSKTVAIYVPTATKVTLVSATLVSVEVTSNWTITSTAGVTRGVSTDTVALANDGSWGVVTCDSINSLLSGE